MGVDSSSACSTGPIKYLSVIMHKNVGKYKSTINKFYMLSRIFYLLDKYQLVDRKVNTQTNKQIKKNCGICLSF